MAIGGRRPGGRPFRYRGSFFDGEAVIAFLDKKARRAFMKFGAYVRTAAKSSLKYQGKKKLATMGKLSARAGSPPAVHKSEQFPKSPLKNLIYFGYDESIKGVVIGPAILMGAKPAGNVTVPQGLEKGGGKVRVREWHLPLHYMQSLEMRTRLGGFGSSGWRPAGWYRADQTTPQQRRGRQMRVRLTSQSQFPFMAPALKRELPKLKSMFV